MDIKLRDVKVIILSGKARVGKDTTSSYMKEYYENKGLKVINLQYSTAIKEYAKRITGWDGSDDTKPREFLQMLGTEIIRDKIDEEFFIKRMIQDIKVYSYFYDVVIISDARLVKEITMLKNSFVNVYSVNIFRDFESELSDTEQKHRTEIGLDGYDDYDYVIYNNGTLENLRDEAISVASQI